MFGRGTILQTDRMDRILGARVAAQQDMAMKRRYDEPEMPTVFGCVENCRIPDAPQRVVTKTDPIPRVREGFRNSGHITGLIGIALAIGGIAVLIRGRRK